MKFYTSDHHFDHGIGREAKRKTIVDYSNRPFWKEDGTADIEAMNEAMIQRWNEVVGPKDDVYHLGDFCYGNTKRVREILDRLNGRKHLVWGNHDSGQIRALKEWSTSQPYLEIKDGEQRITLCHYAHKVWNRAHYGTFMLYGHSHGNMPGSSQSTDVGVDCWDFYPVSMPTILERLATLPPYAAEDHHKRGDEE